jgi:phosphohistidine phosphatase
MDLILWRHAEAEDGDDDAARRLTRKGVKQAERMGAWLDTHLPKQARKIVSPAVRAQQTAAALARDSQTSADVYMGADAADVLKAAGWPEGKGTVVIVGHQPTLGAAAALALTGRVTQWRVKKGAVWWLSTEKGEKPYVVAVVSPDLLD